MTFWRRLIERITRRSDRDLDRELRAHLEIETEEQQESGLPPEEARYAAHRAFGNVNLVKENVREAWGWNLLEMLAKDLRFAVRQFRKSPGFTAVAVLSLALGIGANTAIFSILHALILRSLPVSDPPRLVVVTRNETVSSPYPFFVELRDHSRTLEGVLSFRTTSMRFSKDDETERITGALVSGTYFGVLGVRTSVGTAIANEDDQIPGSGGWRGPVAVLSHSFWLRRFGGQVAAVGTRILLNGHPFTVAGVGPPGFNGTEVGEPADVFAPMMMQEALLPGLGTALTQPRSQWLRIFGRLKPLPGVISAALADSPPLGIHTGWDVFVPGYTPKTNEPRESPSVGSVSSGYFTTMGIPLLLGRDIDDRDVAGARVVVNETFARHYFSGESPVGRRVGTNEGVYKWEIIGVVKDSKYTGLREGPVRMIYVPARPGPWASRTVVHLRTSGNPAALASALRQKVHDLDKTATIFDVQTVQDEMDRSLLRERLLGTITGLFGGLALALAAIGLYGLMSYGVARRTREFGIRMAIGAATGNIVGLVVGKALWVLVAGTMIGLVAAWVLGRVVTGMLFGIEPADPVSAALAVLVLVTAALVAAWIPARRASRIDPMVALRYE